MFYLKQLCLVSLPPDDSLALFTVVAELVSPWPAIPGLLLLSAVILVFACWPDSPGGSQSYLTD